MGGRVEKKILCLENSGAVAAMKSEKEWLSPTRKKVLRGHHAVDWWICLLVCVKKFAPHPQFSCDLC